MIEYVEMAKKTGKGSTPLVAFRLSDELQARLDRHVERMSEATPGVLFTRTDAIRSLLTQALDIVEGRKRKKGKS